MDSKIRKIYLIAFVLLSCTESDRTSTVKIQLSDAMDRTELLDASELSETVTYIPLETNDSVIVGNIPDITVLDSVILVSSLSQSLQAFDRKTGKFIANIGHIGNDPEGYAADPWGNIAYTASGNRI